MTTIAKMKYLLLKTKERRKKYVGKFRKILKKWKLYYSQFEGGKISSIKWIKDEHVDKHFNRWNSINNINNCWYKEIEVR